jgi:hypothetical protein
MEFCLQLLQVPAPRGGAIHVLIPRAAATGSRARRFPPPAAAPHRSSSHEQPCSCAHCNIQMPAPLQMSPALAARRRRRGGEGAGPRADPENQIDNFLYWSGFHDDSEQQTAEKWVMTRTITPRTFGDRAIGFLGGGWEKYGYMYRATHPRQIVGFLDRSRRHIIYVHHFSTHSFHVSAKRPIRLKGFTSLDNSK